MRENVLRHKMAHLVVMLAEHLRVSEEEALDIFFSTRTYDLLSAQKGGLHLYCDDELLNDIIQEISQT